jgi:tetratricopeptide (TPR) repeat protein
VQAFVIYEDGTLGSREQAISLGDKTLATAERLGHLGAIFMVLSDRIREAAMLGDLPQVEALGPQILDTGERGGLPWRYVGNIYLGLAAHWRGNTERAEAELRKAMELEPPAAFAGQSASLLARHLAYLGRTEEVIELFESARSLDRLPGLEKVNGIGSWNGMLGFVEALYLCGLHEQAVALSRLWNGRSSLAADGSPSTAGWLRRAPDSSPQPITGGTKPNAISPLPGRPPSRCPTGWSWLTYAAWRPGCCWTAAPPVTTCSPRSCSRRR